MTEGGWWRALREMHALPPRVVGVLSSSPIAGQLEVVGFSDYWPVPDAAIQSLPRFPKLDALAYRARHRQSRPR